MKQTIMVGLACFAGALIGALVSLELAAHYSWDAYAWPVGAILGGLVAYLSYDFAGLWSGVKHAFHEVIVWTPTLRWCEAGWRGTAKHGGRRRTVSRHLLCKRRVRGAHSGGALCSPCRMSASRRSFAVSAFRLSPGYSDTR